MIHCENCRFWKDGYCALRKKQTNDGASCDKAEGLYNAGYRKIDDDCAVITKDELKEYKRQAVKEFAERLKEHTILYNGINVKYEAITADIIYELLKEYK